MSDIFITKNNFADYMADAINVYIATSYLNRCVIDDIKANLDKQSFKSGRHFRFLLNKDFHEDPQMRKVLVNMLLELPRTEVRIYNGEKFFHGKLYLYETGNAMFVAIGSFNATAGGAGKNIETGAKLHDREMYKQAKAFFDSYWDSPETEKAEFDPSAVFIERKFKPGDPVIIKSSGKTAVILNVEPMLVDSKWWQYSVLVDNYVASALESDLEHVDLWYASEPILDILETGIGVEEWIKNYILEKVRKLSEKTLASYASSRTDIYPYQFRPLLKLLQSSEHRLLIADEVGLGKTIEAGIILKELQFRLPMKRVLVIVPNSLKNKWKDELRIRFDEFYDTIYSRDVIDFLNDYDHSSEGATIKGIITYDQLIGKSLRDKLDTMSGVPIFDMIIIDEAHHLKNEATLRHKTIKRLTKNSAALILLTATPIQLATRDLYNLLSILLPTYADDAAKFGTKLTLNQKLIQAIKYLNSDDLDHFKSTIVEIASKKAFQKQLEHFDDSSILLKECLDATVTTLRQEKREFVRRLYSLNVLNNYVSRTLRKDVAERFPERIVETQVYEYNPEEKALYDAILDFLRKRYKKSGKQLALVTFERQAASSLTAFAKALRHSVIELGLDEYQVASENAYDIDEGDPSNKATVPDKKTYDELASQIKTSILSTSDAKLGKLKEIIQGIFSTCTNDKDKKILIFCTFIATVTYLKEELKKLYPNVFIETLTGSDDASPGTGGGDISVRDAKRKSFKDSSPSILICSEVAGEGLDFQFCHYLINYDMPWNPSRLEQRVGRIDRLGQVAERITVINLVNKYTIEDYIMARLFERVKLFNNTIGPLGEVLGSYQKEFNTNILKPERTAAEKKEYEKRVMQILENKHQEQIAFEQSQPGLFGVVDYFYDESQVEKHCFHEKEIEFIWNYFLSKLGHTNNVYAETADGESIFRMHLDDNLRKSLLKTVRDGLSGSIDKKKREHYTSLINDAQDRDKPLYYTFNNKKAVDNLGIEFLSITHPFIQGALQYLEDDYKPNREVIFCSGFSNVFDKGTYVLLIHRFNIRSAADPGGREFIEEHVYLYNLQTKLGVWQSPDVVFDIMSHAVEEATDNAVMTSINAIIDNVEIEAKKIGKEAMHKYEKMLDVEVNKKRETLVQTFDKRVSSIRTNLQGTHDQYQRDKMNKEIKNIEIDREQKLSKMSTGQLKVTIRRSGVIVFKNSEVRRNEE